jgi:hypothetical protein
MNDHDAEKLAQVLTECAYSTRGCQGFPVRMLTVLGDEENGDADASVVMLCATHEYTYVPTGEVIFDKQLSRLS